MNDLSKNLRDALALIEATKNALADGTQHYDERGRLLMTPKAIIGVMARGGQVTVVPRREQ